MANEASLAFVNLEEFLRELDALPNVLREKLMRGACATGASVVREEVVRRAPEFKGKVAEGHPPPGTLKRAVYQTRMTQECTRDTEVFLVGIRSGRGAKHTKGKNKGMHDPSRDAFYAHWVEYGHWTRTPGTTSKQHRKLREAGLAGVAGAKWIPPRPFFNPAFEAKKQAAVDAMREYIARNLATAAMTMKYVKALEGVGV